MSKAAQSLRRYLIAVLTFSVMLTSGAYAIANSDTSRLKGAIYACVTNDYSTLNLTSAKAKCPAGQRKIAWNVRGPKGKKGERGAKGLRGADGKAGAAGAAGADGLAGAAGANGLPGAAGAAGADGVNGEVGPTGPAGANGADGLTGPTGPAGANGATGPTGITGPMGATGATGPQGDPGAGTILTSNSPIQASTFMGGLVGESTLLPFSGSLPDPVLHPGVGDAIDIDDAQARKVTQLIPRNGQITHVSGWFSNAIATQLLDNAFIQAEIFISDGGYAPLVAVPGTQCTASPSMTGVISINDKFTMNCSGLAIPVSAGSVGLIRVSIVSDGPSPVVVSLTGSVGVGIS